MSTPDHRPVPENPPTQRQSSPGFTRALGVIAVLLGCALLPAVWSDPQMGWSGVGMTVFFILAGLVMSITGKSPTSAWWV